MKIYYCCYYHFDIPLTTSNPISFNPKGLYHTFYNCALFMFTWHYAGKDPAKAKAKKMGQRKIKVLDLLTRANQQDVAIGNIRRWGWKVLQLIYQQCANSQNLMQPFHFEVLQGERNVLWINLTPQEGDLSQERLLHYRLFLLKSVLVELYDVQKNIKYC